MNFLVGSHVITESLIRQRQDKGEGKVKAEVNDCRVGVVQRKGLGQRMQANMTSESPKSQRNGFSPKPLKEPVMLAT